MTFTMWHAWVAGWISWVLSSMLTIGFGTWGFWTGDERGGVAVLFGVIAFIGLPTMCVWTADAQPRRPSKATKLSREAKRKLAAAEQEIALDRAIRDLERENGMR